MAVQMSGATTTIVYGDIVFDAKLDESLFSLEAPEGYTLNKSEFKISMSLEENIVGMLRLYSKRAEGKFPDRLNDWGPIAQLATLGDKPGELDAESQQLMNYVGTLHGLTFQLEKGKDYDYRPGAKLGESNAIVFWNRDKVKGTYRAVYGDLSVKDLKAEDVPPPVKEVLPVPQPTAVPSVAVPVQPAKQPVRIPVPAPVVARPPQAPKQ